MGRTWDANEEDEVARRMPNGREGRGGLILR